MENNCKVMSPDDHSHVSQSSPIMLKRKELELADSLLEPELRKKEDATAELRKRGQIRPLGGL